MTTSEEPTPSEPSDLAKAPRDPSRPFYPVSGLSPLNYDEFDLGTLRTVSEVIAEREAAK